jgi:hypothetical protein
MASGQTCIELIANALSKLLSAKGKASALPRRSSTRPALDGRGVARGGLADQLGRRVDAGDVSRRGRVHQERDTRARAEADLQHGVVRLDVELGDGLATALAEH